MIYFRELRNAIKRKYGCDAVRLKTEPVRVISRDEAKWDGAVEVFALVDFSRAKHCYAWGFPSLSEPDGVDVITVLEVPPVASAESAVRAAIARGASRLEGYMAAD